MAKGKKIFEDSLKPSVIKLVHYRCLLGFYDYMLNGSDDRKGIFNSGITKREMGVRTPSNLNSDALDLPKNVRKFSK